MKEKVLVLASVASMIDQFNMPNIELLQSLGFEVHVACNFEDGNTCSNEKIIRLKKKLDIMNVKVYQIDFTRSVFDLKQDIIAYKQVKTIMKKNKYKFIHCHSPIGGVIGRLVSKSTKTKCIYTAHGFHFYKGASIKNWILFYPVEKLLSKYTDVLITINKEDFETAKRKFKSRCIKYVPGVGIDLSKFRLENFNRIEYRKKLNLNEDDFMIFSVGELNKNKNHEVVINALSKLCNNHVHYYIAGQGSLESELKKIANEKGIENNIHFLGFRTDVLQLYQCADLFIHPSYREGLSVSLMEAMASGKACIVSFIRGNTDLINERGGYLFPPDNVDILSNRIRNMINSYELREEFSKYNREKINQFSIDVVEKVMRETYLCEI